MVGIGAERLQRHIGDETAADAIGLHAAHIGRPAVMREGAGDHRGEGEAGVHPDAVFVGGRVFAVAEAVVARAVILPGRAGQHARQRDADEAHVGTRGQAAPARVIGIAQRRGEVGRGREIGKAVHFQQRRARRRS